MPTNPVTTEPVITASVIQSLVAAVLTLLTSFGVAITGDQRVAILGVFAIAAPLAVGWWTRRHVTPSS